MLKKKHNIIIGNIEIHDDKVVIPKEGVLAVSYKGIDFSDISGVCASGLMGPKSDDLIIIKLAGGREERVHTHRRASIIAADINAALNEYKSKSKKRGVNKKAVVAATTVAAANRGQNKYNNLAAYSNRPSSQVNSGKITTETYLRTYGSDKKPDASNDTSNNRNNSNKKKTGLIGAISSTFDALKTGEVKNYNSSKKK